MKEPHITSRTRSSAPGLYLTYAAPLPGDGAGAQVQRIFAVYGVSRNLGLNYAHTGLLHIGPNPGDSFADKQARDAFLNDLNALVALPEHGTPGTSLKLSIGRLPRSVFFVLPLLHRVLRALRLSVVLAMQSPYGYVESNTDSYRHASSLVGPRLKQQTRSGGIVALDVHIRRTLSPSHDKSGKPYERHLDTSWYSYVLEQVARASREKGRHLRIRVHTDRDPNSPAWELPADTPPEAIELWNSIGAIDESRQIRYDGENFEETFGSFGEIEVVCNEDPIAVWTMMANSDLLICGPSSFSFVGGLMRQNRPTITPTFWHKAPSHWLTLPKAVRDLEANSDYYGPMITEYCNFEAP